VKTWALIVDTWRESFARYTLLGFVAMSTLFLLIVAFALNLDIVDGALAAITLFGHPLDVRTGTSIDQIVVGGLAAFAGLTYALGVFLAVFTTGSQVPNLVRRGTVDLYLARPLSRTHVLLGRFAGASTLVLANLTYLCGGLFLIVSLKTGVWNTRFLLAGAVIFAVFISFLGFMFLVGVISGSTPLSIMLPYAVYVISMPLAAHQRIEALVDSRLAAQVVNILYWALPKTAELGRAMVRLVLGRGAPGLVPLATTLAFGGVCLTIGAVVLNRRSF
jgi:ABC-2 type transport system permease protein